MDRRADRSRSRLRLVVAVAVTTVGSAATAWAGGRLVPPVKETPEALEPSGALEEEEPAPPGTIGLWTLKPGLEVRIIEDQHLERVWVPVAEAPCDGIEDRGWLVGRWLIDFAPGEPIRLGSLHYVEPRSGTDCIPGRRSPKTVVVHTASGSVPTPPGCPVDVYLMEQDGVSLLATGRAGPHRDLEPGMAAVFMEGEPAARVVEVDERSEAEILVLRPGMVVPDEVRWGSSIRTD